MNPLNGYYPFPNTWKSLVNASVARQVSKISRVGIKLNYNQTKLLSSLVANMSGTYSSSKICSFMNGSLPVRVS